MNIKQLAQTKPHNSHYLNKYLKFIERCKTRTLTEDYTETHHILPKAKDLFPEYIDLKVNVWNAVELTSHEHILVHVILWKAYGGSQTCALDYMLNVQNETTRYNKRKIPTSISIRYAAKLRQEAKSIRAGFATYKDPSGNKYYLHSSDPLIQELNLVGNNTGYTMTEESKQKMSDAKLPNRKIRMYHDGQRVSVLATNKELIDSLLEGGWTFKRTQEQRDFSKAKVGKILSEKLSGRVNYALPNGTYFGRLYKDDHRIIELNLTTYVTDVMRENNRVLAKRMQAANVGMTIYNNGVKEKKFKNAPTDSQWIEGRLPRDEAWTETFKNAVLLANTNMIYWNNGSECKKYPKGVLPSEEGWTMGMLPRKAKNKPRKK